MVDQLGKIGLVNSQAEKLFGYRRDELVGQPVEMLVPVRFRDNHPELRRRFFAEPLTRPMGAGRDLYGLRKDGSEFPVEIGLNPIKLGQETLVLSAIVDITERKKVEQQLRFYAQQLEMKNADLTRSNQELDEFAYVASHDLKEPLRGIHNYAAFLLEDYHDKLDDEGRNKLVTLQRLARRLEELTDSLLQYSRVGRLEPAMQPADLDQIVKEVLESLRITLIERDVTVRMPRPLPCILCDRVRIAEVFRNLITNAMKYNDNADKWIEIGWQEGVAKDAQERARPIFYVRDNGIGILEKHFEAIFRIFKRLHGRDKFGGGTGAGLTIVKKIIERHGGTIWVESSPGAGSTFFFTIATEQQPWM